MIYIYFYLKNSILISRGIMFFNVVLTYLISIYLMIQSIYKLNIMFDWFNLVYLIIGITLFVYANYLNSDKHIINIVLQLKILDIKTFI